MIFQDLLKKHTYSAIAKEYRKLFPGYKVPQRAISYLRNLELIEIPTSRRLLFYIIEDEEPPCSYDCSVEIDEEAFYSSVALYPRRELISLPVVIQDSAKNLTEEELLAVFFWELTWYGYVTDEEIDGIKIKGKHK